MFPASQGQFSHFLLIRSHYSMHFEPHKSAMQTVSNISSDFWKVCEILWAATLPIQANCLILSVKNEHSSGGVNVDNLCKCSLYSTRNNLLFWELSKDHRAWNSLELLLLILFLSSFFKCFKLLICNENDYQNCSKHN